MHPIDWLIIAAYLAYIIYSGVRMSRNSVGLEGYFLANRSLPWWAVGLSVMATQLSAITLVGATGQGYSDGMRFIQFYFGLPLAMVILCMTVVPFFHRANVFTAYEYLEKRFDARTRTLTSLLFLLSRGLAVGVVVAAPSVILSIVLGWNELATILAMGVSTTIYTMFGGVRAVTWTDVKQMVVIFFGLAVVLGVIISQFPSDVGFVDALSLAGANGRLKTIDTTFDLSETYTLWSGLIGGLFLMLAYFGCDQSQVQRYLTARSVAEGRISLLMSAFVKIPMQFLILLIGVLVFVFYQFNPGPMIFNSREAAKAETGAYAAEYGALESEYQRLSSVRASEARQVAKEGAPTARWSANETRMKQVREQGIEVVKKAGNSATFSDVNYVFPTFVTTHMPVGVVGLIIAAIFAAAMSTISAELNSLATATVIDFYRRRFRPDRSDEHYLRVGKLATAFWGVFACVVAYNASQLGSLIEVVNKFGSFFYGSLLGVFVLAMGTRRANGTGAFWGLLSGMTAVALVSYFPDVAAFWQVLTGSAALVDIQDRFTISFLWYNVIGCVVVVIVGMTISLLSRRQEPG